MQRITFFHFQIACNIAGGYLENVAYEDGYYGRADAMDPRQMGNGYSNQQHHYDPDYDDCQDNDFDMDFGGDFGFWTARPQSTTLKGIRKGGRIDSKRQMYSSFFLFVQISFPFSLFLGKIENINNNFLICFFFPLSPSLIQMMFASIYLDENWIWKRWMSPRLWHPDRTARNATVSNDISSYNLREDMADSATRATLSAACV